MKHQPPPQPAPTLPAADPLADYTPVRLAQRHDGWTADRQRLFLTALAETGCISNACAAAGITARSAYRLRCHPRAAAFAQAWDQALLVAVNRLVALAYERAANGTSRQYWKNGQLVAEVRQPSDQMLIFLLKHLAPEKFGSDGHMTPPEPGVAIAQAQLPDLLDALADADVAADPLTDADYEVLPPDHRHEPLIDPADTDDSW